MILKFAEKLPTAAYISNKLWLPKSLIRVGPVKRALEFTVTEQGKQTKYKMWEESSQHIICPREFLHPSEYPKYNFPFIDIRPKFEANLEIEDLVILRNKKQEDAWKALSANNNGILNLACGGGKTKLMLKKIAQRKVPTLVIVPDGGILDQWKRSIYGDDKSPPGLKFKGKLGLIQGKIFDWKHPITLALVTTLALRFKANKIPSDMLIWFPQIIWDEVHQIGAPVFSLTAAPFYGDKLGATATVTREDGLDPIYRYHIGEPFYVDLSQDLIPDIIFQQTSAKIDYEKAKINGISNVSILRSLVGRNLEANIYRYWCIKKQLDQGRKILCLSHSKLQLRLFHKVFPGSGLILGETDRDERTDILRKSQICFAISRLGSQGVDDDSLDTLFWLTPFKSKVSLQQSMGRIQREKEGKRKPLMVIFEDYAAPTLKNLCSKIRYSLKNWGFLFTVEKPSHTIPKKLPSDLQSIYNEELSLNTEDEDSDE